MTVFLSNSSDYCLPHNAITFKEKRTYLRLRTFPNCAFSFTPGQRNRRIINALKADTEANSGTKFTLSTPILLRLYTLPSRSNLTFLISDIRALWCSALRARVPESLWKQYCRHGLSGQTN